MDCMLISHVDSAVSCVNVNWRIVAHTKLFMVALVLQWMALRCPVVDEVGGSVQKGTLVERRMCVTCPAMGTLLPL